MDRMVWLSNDQTVSRSEVTANHLVQKDGRCVQLRSGAANKSKVVCDVSSSDFLAKMRCSVKAENIETIMVRIALFEQCGARVDEGNEEDVMAGWEGRGDPVLARAHKKQSGKIVYSCLRGPSSQRALSDQVVVWSPHVESRRIQQRATVPPATCQSTAPTPTQRSCTTQRALPRATRPPFTIQQGSGPQRTTTALKDTDS